MLKTARISEKSQVSTAACTFITIRTSTAALNVMTVGDKYSKETLTQFRGFPGAGELPQWLRAKVALPEVLS